MKIKVTGVVQGVGFRPQVARIARSLDLRGYVKNVGSYVEIFLEDHEQEFLEAFKADLPPLARIEAITLLDEGPSSNYDGFAIIKSTEGYKNYMFPADTAVCGDCLDEMFDEENRRYLYPFTNCVNCGARYTVAYDLPYDRDRTSMSSYDMCDECKAEFLNPGNRRFDAQTISCPACGPRYALYDSSGSPINTNEPIGEYAKAIDRGKIGVAKSWGGMHISVTLDNIERFRKWYRRPTKPFAVMVRDIDAALKYANLSMHEIELLSSRHRPIVLVNKKDFEDPTLDLVSPGLPNIGLYLPYAGLHHVLFHYLESDAIINTSGNFPNDPMIINNEDVFRLNADYYLLHDREIVNRTDDSLIRSDGEHAYFIRKSRGYVPDIINVDYQEKYLAFGAEMNSRISISRDGYLFSSQYLGETSYYNNMEFLESTVHRFLKMLEIERLDGIAIDMHPQFAYRKFAAELAQESGVKVKEIQHHHAHAASLMFDNSENRMLVMAMDGTGYGTDGKIWGGEVLDSSFDRFDRVASLEEIPMPGGESAIRSPMKIVYGINEMLGGPLDFPYDADLYNRVVKNSIKTTSFGRVLDGLSAYLGICDAMRYDGEPAMKLEKYLHLGSRRFDMKAGTESMDGRKIFRTLPLFQQLFDLKIKTERDKADAAFSFVYALLEEIADYSIDYAEKKGINIGLTGGVSYNSAITNTLKALLGDVPLRLHNSIPNGDGGISTGQNLVLSKILE